MMTVSPCAWFTNFAFNLRYAIFLSTAADHLFPCLPISNMGLVGSPGEMGWSYSLATVYQNHAQISWTKWLACALPYQWKH
jgi:hypothetical protein